MAKLVKGTNPGANLSQVPDLDMPDSADPGQEAGTVLFQTVPDGRGQTYTADDNPIIYSDDVFPLNNPEQVIYSDLIMEYAREVK
ncbi:MAG: hypothetical protein NT009_12780 [Proteobacteria bacterium]|nr:hypothetical protein [Pseudomonadota bacterium]